MGQYGNQPDFATKVNTVASLPLSNINSAAIYIGAVTTEGSATSITVRPVGNSTDVTFSGLSSGSFFTCNCKRYHFCGKYTSRKYLISILI